ncbi:MAG: DUF4231 domain-containing protein [Chloroflexota bacterium]
MLENLEVETAASKNIPYTTTDEALLAAWRRFLDYDATAKREKRIHTGLRIDIILYGLISAILLTVIAFESKIPLPSGFYEGFRILLIVLPIAVAAMMTFAAQFAPSLAWVAYRVSAEIIRREIYLYRTKADAYAALTPEAAQDMLLKNIQKADEQIDTVVAPAPYLHQIIPNVAEEIVKSRITDNAEWDKGFEKLDPVNYIEWRVKPQRNWYIKKTGEDYAAQRLGRICVLIFAGLSAFFAAIRLEPLIIFTSAASVSIGLYTQLKMHGRIYGLYHTTAKQLDLALNSWAILTPSEQKDGDKINHFVTLVEETFQNEREKWKDQAAESQMAVEQALLKETKQSDFQRNIFTIPTPSLTVKETMTSPLGTSLTTEVNATPANPVERPAAGDQPTDYKNGKLPDADTSPVSEPNGRDHKSVDNSVG